MKKQTILKSMLCLIMAMVCNVALAQTFVEPVTNGRYKLKGDNQAGKPWLTNQLSDNSIVVSADEADAAIFEKTANGLKDVATGKYLGMSGSAVSLVDNETNVTIGEYNDNNATGSGLKFSIKVSNNYMYNNNTDGKTHESSDWITNIERYWGFIAVADIEESELESITYTVDKTTGSLYKDGGNTTATWNDTWRSTTTPQLQFSCTANNMQWINNQIEINTGKSGSCTYTVTAPEGYSITAYSFTFANNNHDTENTLAITGGNSYTTSREAKTISAEHSFAEGVTSFSFTFSGTNSKGALLTDFTVTVSKPAPGDVDEERENALTVLEEHASKLGTAVGYYSYTIGGTKVGDYEAVKTAFNAAETAEEVIAIAESLALNLPEVGKYYRLKGKTSGNYIDAVNCYSGDQMGMKAANAYSFRGTIFLLDEGNRLKNVATDTYVHGTRHIGATKNNANTWTFSEGSAVGCLYLTANGTSSHQLHDNTNRADRCGSICNNGTHNFIVEEVPSYTLTVNAPAVAGATGTWNGETKALPATWALFNGESVADANATLTISSVSHTLASFKEGEEVIDGNSIVINTLTTNRTLTATFTPSIFSTTYGEKWVRLQNCSNKSYWATVDNTTAGSKGKTATLDYADEKQLWCLVGTAESFVLYNKAAGNSVALKVTADSYANGSLATLESDTEATWKLVVQDFGYALVPTHNTNNSNLGINMYGGAGGDLKLYSTGSSNTGSYWVAELADANPITLNVTVDKVWESSPRVAELTFTVNGKASTTRILGSVEGQALYLPAGATYEVSSMTYRGYTFNGCNEKDGILTASYTANNERTLYYSPRDGHPYRIPAIATAANGDIFAICDYRPCGNDIGYGEVDLVCRVSSDNGVTWTEERTIADGLGHINDGIWKMGYGDPAIVADRESNEVLVMSVCGNRTCWDGNYGEGGENENPNRISRLYITYNEDTKEWIYGEPEEVTYDIYPLFKNESGEAYVASMFIGAGKICQSRVVKKGDYYRLYCAVWAVTKSIRQHHNYVIYSDDFGKTWNVLGDLGYENSASKWGNEPKCEELPDGTVVLSSRKYNGRYFNLFKFDNDTYTTGSWLGEVGSNEVSGGLSFGGNSTNGEIYKVKAVRKSDDQVCDLMFQSIPTGNDRSNVAIYYKEMEYNEDGTNLYTSATFATGWIKGKHVSTKGSCYSTMILQADGRIAFFFEEEPSGYCMVYIPYTIEELTGDEYTLYTKKEEGEGGTTDIESSELKAQGSGLIYDLQGRRVENPTKGIYIVGGRKVVK